MLISFPASFVLGEAVFGAFNPQGEYHGPGGAGLVATIALTVLIGMLLSELVDGIASQLGIHDVQSGPTVIGFAAGFLISLLLVMVSEEVIAALLVFTGGPFAGALAGSIAKKQASALAVGGAVGLLTIVSMAFRYNFG